MVEPIVPKNNRALPHVALYTRVSTRDQVEEGYSLADQEHQLRRWCDDQFGKDGYTSALYCDDGYSGAWGLGKPYGNAPRWRPRLTEMVADIEAGHVDAVVFVRVDRLTRSAALWAQLLEQYFLGMDVRAVSIKEGFDLGTPHGRLAAGLMVQIASYFREWTADNLRDALMRRKELGYPHGKPPFGWRWQTESEIIPGERRGFEPMPEEGQWVARAARWFLSGWSPTRISQELNRLQVQRPGGAVAWTASDVRRVLRCPTHAGLVIMNEGLVRARHWDERYYDDTTYQQIMELMRQRGQTPRATLGATHYLLGGMLECGHCGRKLFGLRNRTDDQLYYRCERRETPDGTNCPGITKLASLLHNAVVNAIRDVAESDLIRSLSDEKIERLITEQDTDLDGDLRRLRAQYRRQLEVLEGLTRLRMDDELTAEEFQFQANPVRAQRDEIMARIEALEAQREARELRRRNTSEVRDALVAFPELWENLDNDEQRRLLQLTVEKLVLHGPSETAVLKRKIWQMPEQEVYLPNVRSVGEHTGEGCEALTVREMEFLDLRHQGLSVGEIAARWQVPPQSVYQYQWRALRKVGAADAAQAWDAAADHIEAHRHVLHRKPRLQRASERSRPWRPTERQLQVVRNRLSGMSAARSAEALGIKRGTVHATVDQMKKRAGIGTFEELVDMLVEWGLIDRPSGDREEEAPETSGWTPVTLGQMQFRVWTLHSDGKSRGEIAKALGIEPSAVTQNLYHVRKKLRAWMEASQAEDGRRAEDAGQRPGDAELMNVPFVQESAGGQGGHV